VLSTLSQPVRDGEKGLINAEARAITLLDRKQVNRLVPELQAEGQAVMTGYGRGARYHYKGGGKECLRILLRGRQPVVVCPARGIASPRAGHFYGIGGSPKSWHILRARVLSISACLGIADCLLSLGFCHSECRAPSRSSAHPWVARCSMRRLRFTRLWSPPHTAPRLRLGRPGG
jgi:hypothetical protein